MLKDIKAGMKLKQIKEIGCPEFDSVGREFEVKNINESVVMCSNSYLTFGIEKNELLNYFEIVPETINIVNNDGIRIIYNDRATIVILPDGTKGVAKCMVEDKFDPIKGYQIALNRAKIKSMQKELKVLCK